MDRIPNVEIDAWTRFAIEGREGGSPGSFRAILATDGEADDGHILSIPGMRVPDSMPMLFRHASTIEIPTLGVWGLILLASLLVALGWRQIGRRRLSTLVGLAIFLQLILADRAYAQSPPGDANGDGGGQAPCAAQPVTATTTPSSTRA